MLCVLVIACPAIAADDPMTKLVNGFCIKCHGQDDPEGDLRLDRLNASFFEDADEEHARTLRLLEGVELIELLTYPQVSTSLG